MKDVYGAYIGNNAEMNNKIAEICLKEIRGVEIVSEDSLREMINELKMPYPRLFLSCRKCPDICSYNLQIPVRSYLDH